MGDEAAVQVAQGVVDADYSQVELHLDAPGTLDPHADTGLASTWEDGWVVLTVARQHGRVAFRIEVHDRTPTVDPAWDAVAELSLRGGGTVRVTGWAGEDSVDGPLLPAVDMRARYAVHGGQDGSEQFRAGRWDEAPAESYVVQLWPAAPAPARVVTASSPWSQYWAFGPEAQDAVQRLRDVPDPERLDLLLDAALDAHPEVAEHLRSGDSRYRAGIIRYAQELFRVAHAAYADLSQDHHRLARLVDERAEARPRR